jgi:hypothetical protein
LKRKKIKILANIPILLFAFLWVIAPSFAISAPPTYYPAGPQTDVTKQTLIDSGWALCWSSNYQDSGFAINAVKDQCLGDYILYAGGLTGSDSYMLLAAGKRDMVFTETGYNQTIEENGSFWYLNPTQSMGFAPVASIQQSSADVQDGWGGGQTGWGRLSWHTGHCGAGFICNGWRVGNTVGLNWGPSHERAIWTSSGGILPSPTPTVEPTPEPTQTIEPSPTASPEPQPSESPEPTEEPSPQPTEPSPEPSETFVQPSETPSPIPTPSDIVPSESPLPPVEPEPTQDPAPEPETSSPESLVPIPDENPTPDPDLPSTDLPSDNNITDIEIDNFVEDFADAETEILINKFLEDGEISEEEVSGLSDSLTEDGVLTEDEKELLVDVILEQADGSAISTELIDELGLDYEDLPDDQPVALENGVILFAEVADALEIFENPSEILGAVFTDPGKALTAVANIGADMTPEKREESQRIVVASVIGVQIVAATNLATGRIR